jgi:hypothetical protein
MQLKSRIKKFHSVKNISILLIENLFINEMNRALKRRVLR